MRKEDYLLMTFVIITLILTKCQTIGLKKMETLYSWDKVDYVFPTEASQKKFIPENVLMLDATVWGGHGNSGKTFVTTPRLRNGTPASLSIVTQQVRNGVNLLQPYPDWSWHNQKGCEGMTSVFRTTVDKCGRLWVLDTGFLHAENRQVCSPQILIFDLATDTLIDRHIFPKDVVTKLSLPITIIVDVLNENIPQCGDAFAYIADVTTFKLIVYDHRRTTSWRIDSHLFYPYPLEGVFNINGVQFDLMDGIFGLALGPVDVTKNNRKLYFHSLASVRESWVPTCVIRNQSLFVNGENKVPRAFKVFDGTRNSQSAAQVMTDDGVLFFGLLTQNSLACWNSKFPYNQQYIETVAQDDTELQFISGIKIDNGNVWATTSRFQQFFTGVMNFTDTNFRILYAPIKELVEGTSCAIASSSNTYLPPPTNFRPFPSQQNQASTEDTFTFSP